MREVISNIDLIAHCGLYCGACRAYLNKRCPGCKENTKATWCEIRTCCQNNKYSTCADCKDYIDVKDCKKFNNLFSKFFALIFRSNRKACIEQIRSNGLKYHADYMAGKKIQSLKHN